MLKGLTSGDSDLQEKAAKEADKIIATEEKQKSTSFGFEKTQINKYENADGPAKIQQNVNEIMNYFIYLFGNSLFLYSNIFNSFFLSKSHFSIYSGTKRPNHYYQTYFSLSFSSFPRK